MSKRNDRILLDDIIECINRIQTYSKNLTYNDFCGNLLFQDAIIRNIEIIGEASNKISLEIKMKYNQVNWNEISGIRNRLIHEYSGVNLDIVWTVIESDLPVLKEQIEKIQNNENYK
jgi:uncharacterized protein with HEPN domain